MRSIIWWQHITAIWQAVMLLLVLGAERVIGVPFLSGLLFYGWFGKQSDRETVWGWLGFALSLALFHRLSFSSAIIAVFAWWLVLEWQFGTYIVKKWWIWLVTLVFSIFFTLLYQPISWLIPAVSWVVGTLWWQWKLRR